MDLQKRNALIQKVFTIYEQGNVLPTVTLEDFFDGNDDDESIAVNLNNHPGVSLFRDLLFALKTREDVQDLFVEIHECPDPEDTLDDDIWLSSVVAFIITSAEVEQVQEWLRPLSPTLVDKGWNVKEGVITPIADHQLAENMEVFRIWWH